MSYKILSDYIRKVDNKNKDLKVLNLQGLSMTKEFRKSTSNIVGTDLSKYKIVKQGQFCCDFMSVIRVHKLPVVLNNLGEDVIISPAYIVFEIVDKNILLPEYLMMWFRRSEFDRYADFRCDSSIRGGFQWEELCEVELPIPSIEKQREIVAQYEAVANKIKINEAICEKLEATAQALYKQWFVDFEFPNEAGQPYKSSGGVMVFNEELEKEIPGGWKVDYINQYVKLSQGLAINASTQHYIQKEGIPLLRITDLINNTKQIFISDRVDKNVIASESDIIVTRTGQVGLVFRNKTGVVYNNCFKVHPKEGLNPEVLYWYLKTNEMFHIMNYLASGSSAQLDLTHKQFYTIKYLLANKDVQLDFEKYVRPIGSKLNIFEKQNQKLTQLQSLLLSSLATLER
ncbi:restriction endonuclease subunit S [Myroides odoratimimus]|uniref:restriction endonuclease subunit S n=1 Tax=Myroides odoratimimus TaxID=76832 RepID=UPI002578D774|nr:restriction endonuclease subunit S [Myroides odoratimimus]MDM1059752.1 restriction endonuclease subunit S [Myroides odoratimimus]